MSGLHSNSGKKWTDSEEFDLIGELNNNVSLETISQNHGRTVGGIKSRQRLIAYKMFVRNIPKENIVSQLNLDIETINKTIERRQCVKSKKTEKIKEQVFFECKITELENEIKTLKEIILKGIYI